MGHKTGTLVAIHVYYQGCPVLCESYYFQHFYSAMKTPVDLSVEERKLLLELEKLEVEKKKYDLAKRSYYVDFLAKIALPAALGSLAWATYVTNTKAIEDRMAFDIDTKRTELRQKEDELFLKKSESERLEDLRKATFIQTNFSLITTPTIDAQVQSETLARAIFPPEDIPDMLMKLALVRASTVSRSGSVSKISDLSFADYKASGLQFVKKNSYEQALQNFETATLLNPSDVEAWSYKAYAEMRAGNLEEALKSITKSTQLRPTDRKLQRNVMLNATKILCSLGRNADALSYIKVSVAAFPDLLGVAKNDGELKQRCNFTFVNK